MKRHSSSNQESLNIREMERVLDSCMRTEDLHCEIEPNQTMTIQFSYRGESFTVVGISRDEFSDRERLCNLGKTLIDEIEATIHVWHFPSLGRTTAS